MERTYSALDARGRARYGSQWAPPDRGPWARFYESGQRIKVETCGLVLTGTVGVTTGWRPVWLLMRTARSIGSPWILDDRVRLIAVQRGGRYVDVC